MVWKITTLASKNLHEVGLLNVDGYYDSLLGFFDKGVEGGFIGPSARKIVISARTATELIQKMEDYIPLHEQVAPSHSWKVEGCNGNL
ncbi:Cytokinin riboside 5'-monophosphate phosphoribohydrolase log8 [Populus alba x Populus x berolinensis]|uniref:cytokinin riboside 5'-monophosphate phosphoribohydrolase n=1 Tax=Populus alba x Populus x berolinensis TaxID=444605 RepID=A0AAD6RBK8_9ROSI|nr:Cytokinin riboside 5'-monophosphate phosphoribohydrolase log8 [Populus alba x Populus x berolinensis]